MRNKISNLVAAICGVMTLVSCAKEVINEKEMVNESRLKVMTRAEGDAVVKTPIKIYVMNGSEECVATQTLSDESEQLSIDLEAGSYSVYAIGGAEEDRYVLPTQENATKNYAISLQEGKSYDDLMTGKSNVTLTSGGENTLTLGLGRKTILFKSVVIKNVPSEASAVSITISPLSNSLLLNGDFQGETGTCTIDLTKQDDNTTWKLGSNNYYQLPSVGNPTITINIDNKSYSYNCVEALAANYKVNIEGEYTDNSGTATVNLTGTITGATWLGEKTIHFTFDEDGTSQTVTDNTANNNEEEPVVPENMPSVGDIYNGCYVLAVNGNQIRVFASEESNNIANADNSQETNLSAINNALNQWSVTGITATWELPNASDVQLIINERSNIINSGLAIWNKSYLYLNENTLSGYRITSTIQSTSETVTAGCYVRPVATVTIE